MLPESPIEQEKTPVRTGGGARAALRLSASLDRVYERIDEGLEALVGR